MDELSKELDGLTKEIYNLKIFKKIPPYVNYYCYGYTLSSGYNTLYILYKNKGLGSDQPIMSIFYSDASIMPGGFNDTSQEVRYSISSEATLYIVSNRDIVGIGQRKL